MNEQHTSFQLPPLIVSPTDVTRVRHELEVLDDYLTAQRLREPGLPVARLPKVSRLLDDLVVVNKANLLHATVRHELLAFLAELPKSVPTVHVSFAVEPSAAALQKIVVWLRQNIHPGILVRVGLQPNIVAGCIVRTTNRSFDFSLQKALSERRSFLLEALNAPAAPPTPQEPTHG